jgi:ankyrin repeat protein
MKTFIELILKLGADPNALNEDGLTALHLLADIEEILFLHEYVHVFQALLNAGTHLDTVADNGETVLSLLKKNVMRSKQMVFMHPYYESL